MRHLRRLPNTVINEQNLIEILNKELLHLDLRHKDDISLELINKIGYLAPNLRSLVLVAVPITNEVLIELGCSCHFLEQIDISLCPRLQEQATLRFVGSRKQTLHSFAASHNNITDNCVAALGRCPKLHSLNLNFCSAISTLQPLNNHPFTHLGLSSLPKVKAEGFIGVLSPQHLLYLDLSFNEEEVSNLVMVRVGMCTKLETLILTGCEHVSDQGVNNLIYGDKLKGKSPQGFAFLKELKVGALPNVSDQLYQLAKRCPVLMLLECNSLQRLTDHFIDQIKGHSTLRRLLINLTLNISEEKLKEVREKVKHIEIIRNTVKMTDPTDDGLRMPLPPASLKVKKPKKKKK